MTMDRGKAVHLITMSAALGRTFEDSGVPGTPDMRQLWDEVKADVDGIRARGLEVEIPFDYALWDDDDDE